MVDVTVATWLKQGTNGLAHDLSFAPTTKIISKSMPLIAIVINFLTNFQNCVAWQKVLIIKNLQVLEMYSLQVCTMVPECCWNKASGALSHFIFFYMLHFK